MNDIIENKIANLAKDLATLDEDVTRIEDRVGEVLAALDLLAQRVQLLEKLEMRASNEHVELAKIEPQKASSKKEKATKMRKPRAARSPNGSIQNLGTIIMEWGRTRGGSFSRAEAMQAAPNAAPSQVSVALRSLKQAGVLNMTGDRAVARYSLA